MAFDREITRPHLRWLKWLESGHSVIGDKLGLFRALASGDMTSAQLAERTGTHERYVREWLSSQAASGSSVTMPRPAPSR